FRDVFLFYDAFRGGGEAEIERPRPYREHIAWLQRQDLAEAEAFWRTALAGVTAPTPLTVDRPPAAAARGGSQDRQLRSRLLPEDSAALAAFARRHQLTLNVLVQAAWGLLLGRYSGQPEVIFGATVSGRETGLPGIEKMLGVFINSLPVRLPVASDRPLQPWLAELRDRLAELRRHEHTPLTQVQEWSGVPRDLPLFESLVVFQNYPVEPAAAARREGLRVEEMEAIGRANFPLTLVAKPGPEVSLRLLYQSGRLEEDAVERLLGHFATLLAGLAEDPGRRLGDLPLLTAPEFRQILSGWVVEEPVEPMTRRLDELFAAHAATMPDAVAVVCEGRSLTYGELDRRANRLARHLRSLGIGRDTRVGLLLERSEGLVVAILAALKAGGAYLPLDPVYPEDRLAYMVADSEARVVVTTEELRGRLPMDGARVVSLDGDARAIVRRSARAPKNDATPADLAYVIYTSGSTGRPKGVMVTHANAARLLRATERWFGFGPDDIWTLFHSAAFDFSVWELWGALAYGGRLVVVPYWISRSPDLFCRLLAEQRVTVLNQTPSAFRQLMWAEEKGSPDDLALRWVIFGGEALDLPALAPWIGRHGDARPVLVNMYGITETTVHVTYRPITRRDVAEGQGSVIGRPIPDLRVYLADSTLVALPLGVPGEILVGGAGLARGYLGRPELTAERFVPDPFGSEPGARLYRSGDLARRLSDGDLEYLGRIDHQVKVRGFRIELGEIEAAIERHPAVKAAVVLARQDGPGEQRLVAYLVPAAPAAVEDSDLAGELRRSLAGALPDYMVPAAFVQLAALPLTANGKIDRRALPAPEEARTEPAPVPQEPPRTALERYLAGLFAQVLKVERVGCDDDFFALGGSSLSGAILINRLQEALGEVVHVVTIFDAPSVAELASFLVDGYAAAVERVWGAESLGRAASASAHVAGRIDAARIAELRSYLDPLPPVASGPAEAKNPPAIFLLAPPRSGTTLLRVMLGGHPRLFAPPELELLGFHTLAARRAAFSGREGRDLFWLEGAVRAVMELHGCRAEEAEELIAGYERDGWSTQRFYRQLQSWLDDRLLVDKTPSYALDPAVLARAEEIFEGARYLHLIRHPYGMIRSFEEVRLDQIFFRRQHPFSRRELAELIWTASHENILSFLESVPLGRRYAVRFEDLLADPHRVLAEVCEFLGIEYDPLMAEPYERKRERMTDGIHAESRMLGDVKFHEHAGVDRSVAERWREAYAEDFLGAPTWEMAESLGYPRRDAGETIERQPWSPGEPLSL
ncbi:MAG TPA: amino acid adenylation domain-containing protein, partial [Thermoanaerobaculia bacterium]|nr:amino acid adenylation domain-containing protein [Thermoanaerobaculia bacterium]